MTYIVSMDLTYPDVLVSISWIYPPPPYPSMLAPIFEGLYVGIHDPKNGGEAIATWIGGG